MEYFEHFSFFSSKFVHLKQILEYIITMSQILTACEMVSKYGHKITILNHFQCKKSFFSTGLWNSRTNEIQYYCLLIHIKNHH